MLQTRRSQFKRPSLFPKHFISGYAGCIGAVWSLTVHGSSEVLRLCFPKVIWETINNEERHDKKNNTPTSIWLLEDADQVHLPHKKTLSTASPFQSHTLSYNTPRQTLSFSSVNSESLGISKQKKFHLCSSQTNHFFMSWGLFNIVFP